MPESVGKVRSDWDHGALEKCEVEIMCGIQPGEWERKYEEKYSAALESEGRFGKGGVLWHSD